MYGKQCFVIACSSVVPVSEASVMIAVSAEHRREALEAVSYAIDRVKSTAAIWKKVSMEDTYMLNTVVYTYTFFKSFWSA